MNIAEQRSRHLELSIQLLRSVLDGTSYAKVAADHRISRSNVEQRIKTVVRRLQAQGAVAGLEHQTVLHVRILRKHREAILDAMERVPATLDPLAMQMAPEKIDGMSIDKAVKLLRYRSTQPDRDVALFLMMLVTGALPLEIARMRVQDYLAADGQVRPVSSLHTYSPDGAVDRPVYFTSNVLNAAMSRYIGMRLRRGWGLGPDPSHRGLDPSSPLFLDTRGVPFEVTLRMKGRARHWHCPRIHQVLRAIFYYADWKGMSASAVRHWLANRLLNLGAGLDQVSEVLGVSTIKSWKRFGQPVRSIEAITGGVL